MTYHAVDSVDRFLEEYTWEDEYGNFNTTKYFYDDENAIELRKERRWFTRMRAEERYQEQMQREVDLQAKSEKLQEELDDYMQNEYDYEKLNASSTARMTVSSYLMPKKERHSRQSRQRHGEIRSPKAMRINALSAKQKRLSVLRKQDCSHKAASSGIQDVLRDCLTDLQSFDRSGGPVSRWDYFNLFSE